MQTSPGIAAPYLLLVQGDCGQFWIEKNATSELRMRRRNKGFRYVLANEGRDAEAAQNLLGTWLGRHASLDCLSTIMVRGESAERS